MSKDKIIPLKNPGVPGSVPDVLTELLREGAQRMLAAAIEAEVEDFLARFKAEKTAEGRQRLVRNGYLLERAIQTGIGAVDVAVPRVRDRERKIRFTSAILPPYLRRTRALEELLPWLYLKGVSTGDFQEALTALLGRDAPGLSASTISRLKETWKEDYRRWSQRDLSNRRYVYLWADGIHFGVRMEDAAQCILVVIGATADGKKELLALSDGYRESEASWREVLLDLRRGCQRFQCCRRSMDPEGGLDFVVKLFIRDLAGLEADHHVGSRNEREEFLRRHAGVSADTTGGKVPIEIDEHLAKIKQNHLGSGHSVGKLSADSVHNSSCVGGVITGRDTAMGLGKWEGLQRAFAQLGQHQR